MTGLEPTHAAWVLLVGVAIVSAVLIRFVCARAGVPGVVGFLVLGALLGTLDARFSLFTEPARYAFALFADLGIIALLFRVGLQSNVKALVAKLPSASLVWMGDVTISAVTAFAAAYYVLHLPIVPALTIGAALSATSVGVSTAVWEDAGALGSSNGQLLIDTAELDDVSAVLLATLLVAVTPSLTAGESVPWLAVSGIVGMLMLKLTAYTAVCLLFAAFLEPRVTALLTGARDRPQQMLLIAGIGFVIAAAADGLGFSLAIGALFAGLVFSRDPRAIAVEGRFDDVYALFVPFFFIHIGMQTDISALPGAVLAGVVLLLAAVAGKFVGAGLPSLLVSGPSAALLIGISMIPRAEIALVVVETGHRLGPHAMPDDAYAAMVLVVLGTCVMTPWLLAAPLRTPQTPGRIRR